MTSAPAGRIAFTDAPALHPNLILGSLQLLFWLFFHPSAWRNYVARLDRTLRPQFRLIELNRSQLGNPSLRRLLLMGYGVWPLFIGLLVSLTALGLGVSVENVIASTTLCILVCVLIGGTLAAGYSTAGGIAFVATFGVAFAIVFAISLIAVGGVPTIVGLGVAAGVAGGLAISTASRRIGWRSTRQKILLVVGALASGTAIWMVRSEFGALTSTIFAFLLSAVLAILALLIRNQLRANVGKPDIAIYMVYRVVGGAVYGSMFAVLLGLLGVLSRSAQGTLAEVSESWLQGASMLLTPNPSSLWLTLFLTSISLTLGLTMTWWRSILLYPMVQVFGTTLYVIDEQRANGKPTLLHFHPAFWDELQRLRLLGLDRHLVLVAERYSWEAAMAMEYLATSRQRWAAQAAQVELDARRLEHCNQVEPIGQAHRSLAAGELEGPASALLRSFSRISQDVEAALGQESSYNQRLALRAVEGDLDGLLRELTRSSDRYAVRFTPIATQWRDVVGGHVRELAEAVELRQEIDSPYVSGVPLTHQQEIFVGRTDIGARVEQLLLDRRRPPLLLYGQRRTGKTSLLNNLGRLLPNSIVPLFVDLQGPAAQASDHAGFLYNLARGMSDSAQRERNLILPPLARESLTADPFTRFDEWLNEVETALGRCTALLSLDEFEALDRALTQGRFNDTDVLGMFRNLIQHRPRFKVLLAGSHTLEELERWAGYLINVQVVHISYLKEDEARKLVEKPVADFALRYDPDASQRVLDLTRCHPFLVQLLCGEIVALKNEQEVAVRRLAQLADVEAAASEALSHGSFFFADIERNQVDVDGRALLRALAARGEGAMRSREQLAAQVSDPTRLERSLASLIQRELIEPADGGYRFQVELIRRWFAQKRDV